MHRNSASSFIVRLCQTACAVTIISSSVQPGVAASFAEAVQSAPIETNLLVPGIRQTPEVWLEMIDRAQSTIDLEEFYVVSKKHAALQPILDALKAAGKRGVRVRMIVDSSFYKSYPADAKRLNKAKNIQVRTINFAALNGIQHAKYFVVDGKDAYSGSANFDWTSLTHIHEIGLHVTDSEIASRMESIFEKDWDLSSPVKKIDPSVGPKPEAQAAQPPKFDSTKELQVLTSPESIQPDDIPGTLPTLLQLIGSAQSSVSVQVYEYSTKKYKSNEDWKLLDDALRSAAGRGVHVQLLVDKSATKESAADLDSLSRVPNMSVKTVSIPTWSGGEIPFARLIHSKYMIVDGKYGWVGSENWLGNYFTNNRNVGILTTRPDLVAALEKIYEHVWTSQYASGI